jgi:hypothetical protein
MKQVASRASCFIPVSCLAYFSNLKMEATCSYETSFDLERATQLYMPEGLTLHNHQWENLKSYIGLQVICTVEDGVCKTKWSSLYRVRDFQGMDVNPQIISHPDIFILTPNSETMQWNDPPCRLKEWGSQTGQEPSIVVQHWNSWKVAGISAGLHVFSVFPRIQPRNCW